MIEAKDSSQTSSHEAEAGLPSPRRGDRWQPLRSGVLNLYRYDYEEFHFEDGRLLLRGNNGSGKSRVLALQLPFLLDGEVSPARVEPDGDSAKRIEWNLLMGRYDERTGYTWIEFGRRAEDGSPQFLTLGCGLKAVSGQTGLQNRWFFITSRRVGRDLFLQNPQRIPLTRDRLAEALGDAGTVYQKAEDYRRAVDEALFKLGARYGSLVELLLRLRRPQLTRKLDENELPNALSEALPTLSAAIVDVVAESFRGLQADKDQVRDFLAVHAALEAFLREYAGYVRLAVARRAMTVRTTHSAYEAAQRAAKDAGLRHAEAVEALAQLAATRSELGNALAGAEAAERTLAESPEMRTADEIRRAGDEWRLAEEFLEDARAGERRGLDALRQAEVSKENADTVWSDFQAGLETTFAGSTQAARTADLEAEHEACVGDYRSGRSSVQACAATLDATLKRRLQALDHLDTLHRDVERMSARLIAAEARLRERENAVTATREAERAASEVLAARGQELRDAYDVWQAGARVLRAAASNSFVEQFADWLERREGTGPVRAAADAARQRAEVTFARRESELSVRRRELDDTIAVLNREIGQLESGAVAPPPPPMTRTAGRTNRPGAPLWRVCDFRADVDAGARAGYEAALQASGLLDAWIAPDGRVMDPTTEDTFFAVSSERNAQPSPGSPTGRTLAAVLAPALDPTDPAAAALAPELIARLLETVGAAQGEGEHWVAPDGAWRLGPVTGRWTKPEADFIGESTRAAARRRRLEVLRAQREETEDARRQVEASLEALAGERATAAAEFAAAPSEEPVLRAAYALETATKGLIEAMNAAERATADVSGLRRDRDDHERRLRADAADLRLETWIDRLGDLRANTQAYDKVLASLWPTLRHGESLAAQAALQREHWATAAQEADVRGRRREAAESAARAAGARFETLKETHGRSVAEILARHEAARAEVARLKDELTTNQKREVAQTAARVHAEERKQAAEQRRVEQDEQRRAAIGRLREHAEPRLLAEADAALREFDGDEEWSVARAVEISRAIGESLAGTSSDDETWRQRQDAIHGFIQELRDRLVSHGLQAETHQMDDVIRVRCAFQARSHTITELHAAIAQEIADRERTLQAKEREIIENHLLAEAAVELQKLIRAAEAWRASANEELHARPTSTGVRFRFQWEPDTEIRFQEIRPILLRRGELWTPAERVALAEFLQGRIAAEQSNDESGSWRDHLARALDYRRWHRFAIERQQEGQWRRLNRTTYGTGSGGEKALALTLPRFAAAAAHYRGAARTAPRLVMLDEAFAGIDPTMRAQCMGVLAQFDLDVVMTSELEWGCYATVPALAIYHLTTLPGLDAVGATRWVWNGRERRQRDAVVPPAEPPAEAPSEPAADGDPAGFALTP
jgi:uncharacterized protein (TIGR02680 family)